MSTNITTSPSATAQSSAGVRRAVTVAGLVGAVASAGFIAGLIVLHDRSGAELARTPVTVAECLVAGLAFIVLAISLSGLAGQPDCRAGCCRPSPWAAPSSPSRRGRAAV